jgi:hypothetical protein
MSIRSFIIRRKYGQPSSARHLMSGLQAVIALLILTFLPRHVLAAQKVSEPVHHTGALDGSAAVVVDKERFLSASDEDGTLRLYRRDRPGPPEQTFNLAPFLRAGPVAETDIEAAARIGDRAFWITSHGRSQGGKERGDRHRFFATDLGVVDGKVKVTPAGQPYIRLLDDLVGATNLSKLKLRAASLLPSKSDGGLNIEGLTATPDGHLLIGFRNPVPRERALLIPLLNPNEVIQGTKARFGDALELDLGGLGIRGITLWQGRYVIIAGPHDGKGQSRLYEWAGDSSPPQRLKNTPMKDLNPEAVLVYPDKELREFQLLSDDSGDSQEKGPAGRSQASFGSVWVKP